MDLTKIRHELHRLAEPSGAETQTQAYILEKLQTLRPTHTHTFANSKNIIAEYDFGDGPCLLFRADFDAVRVQETLPIEYISCTRGVSHKCGHDGHTAILLGLAERLHENPLPCGKILLFFQAAEETGTGASLLLQSGFLSMYPSLQVFALHNIPGEKIGTVLHRTGSFTCSVVSCDIELHGRTSHAAEPQFAICPYQAAQLITNKILSFSQFDLSHSDYRLATLIEFRVGEPAYGVTAGHGVLRFTLRTQNDLLLHETQSEIETLVTDICQQEELQSSVQWREYFAASNNHAEAIAALLKAAKQNGLTCQENTVPFSWGEDFGLLTQHFNGALFGLGAGKRTPALHHPNYDFPDELIETGRDLFYTIACDKTGKTNRPE